MVERAINITENRYIIVYGYDGRGRVLSLGRYSIEDIKSIYVRIKTGDETGVITFSDESTLNFDAGRMRYITKDDGEYIVGGRESIKAWCAFGRKTAAHEGISYDRMDRFA